MAKMQRAAWAAQNEKKADGEPASDPVVYFNGEEIPEKGASFSGPEVEAIIGNKCAVCQKPLSASQLKISMTKFGKPLCPEHQKEA
jgi:hypothetical protein